jgi:hypothetical protein
MCESTFQVGLLRENWFDRFLRLLAHIYNNNIPYTSSLHVILMAYELERECINAQALQQRSALQILLPKLMLCFLWPEFIPEGTLI